MRDKHHILYERRPWTHRREAEQLREMPSLIPSIDREAHNELHRHCPPVPLLGYHALLRTLSTYEPSDDPLGSIGRLQLAMESAAEHPKAHPIERQLAYLAIHAVDLQVPYIKEGLR